MSTSFVQSAKGAALLALTALATVALATVPTVAVAAPSSTSPAPGTSGVAPGSEGREPVGPRRLTAEVRSIEHGPGIVTVDGSGDPGAAVAISGDGVERTVVDVDASGRWTARVPVRPGGTRVLQIATDADGAVVELAVDVLILRAPEMVAVVDGITRTVALDGTGFPGAHLVIRLASEDVTDPEGGPVLGETDVTDDGSWSYTLRGMPFGPAHVEVWQYFDGAHNGGVDEVYTLAGDAEVTNAEASRETGRITMAGRAPAGTLLRFADRGGPVSGSDGRPLTVEVGDDLRWAVEFPFRADARLLRIAVTTHDGDRQVGAAEQDLTVPIAPTAVVHEQSDGTVRLEGAGEPGATILLETDSGGRVLDHDGRPVSTTVGRRWSVTVDRVLLPADAVVVRQEIDGRPQGSVRVALPTAPAGPEPVDGAGPGTGGHRPGGPAAGVHPAPEADSPITASGTLAYTGADPAGPASLAAGLLALGAGVLVAVNARRRRRAGRS
ncbi:hypothetical protein [Curtobacterium luteum]|uniref:Gram-positive cocci surface proteins LPxTG domain-containing protein n=1 Tax=Curtobacterium luteum TaxID=33881 RepID=A0A175S2J9_9MICO|nr:hypothetical protein [Curtobacterium luteum]KTR10010.1 hypothetical protein NS184_02115 [Curtobacterium luteum]